MSDTPRNVLVLGAGMIAPPLVRYLATRSQHRILVGALDTSRVAPILEETARGRAVKVDVFDEAALQPLVREADIVISLLPAALGPRLGKLAIARGVPFVNTSYVSAEMRALDEAARAAGVLLLCECGLDPGLDHMAAVRAVGRVRRRGGRVVSFESSCGGFPAPDANDNPWGYKFSWFPRAVLVAARQPARWLRHGQVTQLAPPELFRHSWRHAVADQGVFEVFANRDALAYRDLYGLADVEGLFRGTLRYPGWCATMAALWQLGLLDDEPRRWPAATTWRDLVAARVQATSGSLTERVAESLGLPPDDDVIRRLEWAGLLSDRVLPSPEGAPLDQLVERLAPLMSYRPGERDMVALEHRLVAAFPDGHTEEITESLSVAGEPFGDSAMSKTVSLPAAVAACLVLSGRIEAVGVQIPTMREVWAEVLAELPEIGIAFKERRTLQFPGPLH